MTWLSINCTLLDSHCGAELTTALRDGAGLDVTTAASINSVQFFCAIAGKLTSGVLLALPSEAMVYSRAILFVMAPIAFCLSHLVLLQVDVGALLDGDLLGALAFVQSTPRLFVYAVVVGFPYGLVFGTLTCLPARLFGRKDLPKLQSASYSAILLSSACTGPTVGWLRDVSGGYQVPLMLTFTITAAQCALLLFLMDADAKASATSYKVLAT